MKAITSRQNPTVQAFRTLARTPDATGTRLLLDGVHLIRDAMAAGVEFESVAVSTSRTAGSEEGEMAQTLASRGAHVLTVGTQAFAAMSPVRAPSGIVAIATRKPVAPDHICERDAAFVLAAVDVQDPGNIGAVIRASEAGGVTGVLVCGASANPFSWKAVRGSMGSILRLPVASGVSVGTAISCIREHGGRVVAAVPRGGRDPDAIDWRGRVLLLFGGEGPGLDAREIEASDDRVTIPMAPGVESLNVASAAAILVYAARRQRVPLDDGRGSLRDSRRL